ncbi:MAG: phosphoribosylanthranilate isomerase [Candidatus Omnitrophica bacterium]|nr:phosphoribosylanthranilate isomerase [Candidatus Omnitrophota bacterium]MDD4013792.1 phosphoribosylanthranilate isomerase [Candidatus Omnitrophota bacterium]
MVKVKICGITNTEDAALAVSYGADLLGFVFVPGTPRYVEADIVRSIVKDLSAGMDGSTGLVGLFRDQDPDVIEKVVKECGLGYVQLHGDESPETCVELKKRIPEIRIMKVFKVRKGIMPCGVFGPEDYAEADLYLFDTYHPELSGGTGRAFDWPSLKKSRAKLERPFFVAGGLDPMNVSEVVKALRPCGVDVSSGVESSTGKKDKALMKEFIENARKHQTA